jgi:hypothetical protein
MPKMEKTQASSNGQNSESQAPQPNLIAFTMDADAGRLVKVEKVDGTGARRELSDEEKVDLVNKGWPTLETIIERAFEAGIGCLLGESQENAQQSQEELELWRVLVMSLMEKTSAHDLLRRDVLGRAFLETALQQGLASSASGA